MYAEDEVQSRSGEEISQNRQGQDQKETRSPAPHSHEEIEKAEAAAEEVGFRESRGHGENQTVAFFIGGNDAAHKQ
jgi:hypothetical protein